MKSCGCGEHWRTMENAWDEILHNTNLFLANFWALNCVGNFTGSNLFEPELDLNLWSGPRFRHLPEPNHRSSSRFTEILKEPDRTGLRQHYI